MNQKQIIRIAALSGALSVGLGAFGAHGLEGLVESGKMQADDIRIFETGVRYQFYHSLALLAIGLGYMHLNAKQAINACKSFLGGMIIFSGSLYLLSVSEAVFGARMSWLGAITPLGGLLYIIGWLLLFSAANKKL